jgi:hypothetical protein
MPFLCQRDSAQGDAMSALHFGINGGSGLV